MTAFPVSRIPYFLIYTHSSAGFPLTFADNACEANSSNAVLMKGQQQRALWDYEDPETMQPDPYCQNNGEKMLHTIESVPWHSHGTVTAQGSDFTRFLVIKCI